MESMSKGEWNAFRAMRLSDDKNGQRHLDTIMQTADVVRRARHARFPEGAIRRLEMDLAQALEQWYRIRRLYDDEVVE
jgi:hypothetical protein